MCVVFGWLVLVFVWFGDFVLFVLVFKGSLSDSSGL